MQPTRVLFVCIHNSGRSQMAEAYLEALGGESFAAESAGLKPREIQPLVKQVMAEDGIDLEVARADDIMQFFREGRLYDYVIYVCERGVEEDCPVFPGVRRTLRWPFEDPSRLEGTDEEQFAAMRRIRDAIRQRVQQWIDEPA